MANDGKSTKSRILEATECLVAEHGFEAVSLRDITSSAQVNVAAVNYHFGSKESLFEAIQCRYIEPINDERLRMISRLTGAGRVATVREILEAFMRPFLTVVQRSEMSENLFFKLMGRCVIDHQGGLPEDMIPGIKKVAETYTAALLAAAPDLTPELALWRLHFTFGVMAQTLLHGDLLYSLTDGACGEPDAEAQFQGMIDFCEAGFLTQKGAKE
ncbi:MAG: TetR/AcrR family transcriptional regulator [Akkermansiaceae bacterium]